jgi:hypothetical protein
MSNSTIEQRVAALEAKVAAIEDWLLMSPPRKAGILLLNRRPPLSPEELAIHEEVRQYMREAREAELAEFDREMEREQAMKSKEENGLL